MTANPTGLGEKPGRFDGVQGLRFVAALLVVVTHSMFYAHDRLSPDFPVWRGGSVGVDIFFVISGFVMMITARPFVTTDRGWRYFAMRRIVRIVPMYWIATTLKVITVLVLPAVAINSAVTPGNLLASYFFLPTRNESGLVEPILGVGWTLTFEMFFYAVFCLALVLRINVFVFTSVIMAICALGQAFRPVDWPAAMVYFDRIVLYFIVGMVIALLTKSSGGRRWLSCLVVSLCLVAAILALIGLMDWDRGAWFRFAIVSAIVAAVVLAEPWLGPRIPRAIAFMGDASYSLYLFHPMVAPVVPAVLAILGVASGWLSVGGSILVSILASIVIYWLLEKRLTNALRRLPYAGRMPTPNPGVSRSGSEYSKDGQETKE